MDDWVLRRPGFVVKLKPEARCSARWSGGWGGHWVAVAGGGGNGLKRGEHVRRKGRLVTYIGIYILFEDVKIILLP